jgi:hypothetical protein
MTSHASGMIGPPEGPVTVGDPAQALTIPLNRCGSSFDCEVVTAGFTVPLETCWTTSYVSTDTPFGYSWIAMHGSPITPVKNGGSETVETVTVFAPAAIPNAINCAVWQIPPLIL